MAKLQITGMCILYVYTVWVQNSTSKEYRNYRFGYVNMCVLCRMWNECQK